MAANEFFCKLSNSYQEGYRADGGQNSQVRGYNGSIADERKAETGTDSKEMFEQILMAR